MLVQWENSFHTAMSCTGHPLQSLFPSAVTGVPPCSKRTKISTATITVYLCLYCYNFWICIKLLSFAILLLEYLFKSYFIYSIFIWFSPTLFIFCHAARINGVFSFWRVFMKQNLLWNKIKFKLVISDENYIWFTFCLCQCWWTFSSFIIKSSSFSPPFFTFPEISAPRLGGERKCHPAVSI